MKILILITLAALISFSLLVVTRKGHVRSAMKWIAAIAAVTFVLALNGCTLFGEPIAEKVADVIDRYCEEPFTQRLVYRETVNDELAGEGHSIEVTCNGDPE